MGAERGERKRGRRWLRQVVRREQLTSHGWRLDLIFLGLAM